MQPVKIILVPTDFSPASKQAMEYACNLADMLDASLHIIHVLEDPFTSGACVAVAQRQRRRRGVGDRSGDRRGAAVVQLEPAGALLGQRPGDRQLRVKAGGAGP